MDINQIEKAKEKAEQEIEAILVSFMAAANLEQREVKVSIGVTCWAYSAADWKYRADVNINIRI